MPTVKRFGPRKFAYTPTSVEVVNDDGSPAALYDSTGTAVAAAPTIAADGSVTFYAVPGRYRLKLNRPSGEPVRHSTVLDSDTQPGTGGGGSTSPSQQRSTVVHTTPALATGQVARGTVSLATGYRVLRVATNRPARVRLYASIAQRDADELRGAGTDPTGNHGLFMDVVTTAAVLSLVLTPSVHAFVESGSAVPITVTNLDSATGEVAVTLTFVRTE